MLRTGVGVGVEKVSVISASNAIQATRVLAHVLLKGLRSEHWAVMVSLTGDGCPHRVLGLLLAASPCRETGESSLSCSASSILLLGTSTSSLREDLEAPEHREG